MVTIATRPLTVPERARATSLSRWWGKNFETPDVMSGEFFKMSLETLPQITFKIPVIFGFMIGEVRLLLDNCSMFTQPREQDGKCLENTSQLS